ncbi:MAG: CHASE domain-containing protein [Pontiellaceae bacterium]|nr:CHASE domain-containing protein [Pontiellaceae bacterium]MBN2784349.1 CHASE domain-containing protein [Pontiellaceae bacterium]
MVSGFVLSAGSGGLLHVRETNNFVELFHHDVDQHADFIYRELMVNFEALQTLSVLLHEPHTLDPDRLREESQRILKRHSDIQALEWIPRVAGEDRTRYESERQAQHPGFVFTERDAQGDMVTARQRDEYYPVYYVEPLAGNEVALGFDLGSSEPRREALEQSRDRGIPLATASITLVQEQESQKGFLALLPIFEGKPDTLEARRENLIGFVLGVYRIGDIIKTTIHEQNGGIYFELLDLTGPEGKDDLLFVHPAGISSPVLERFQYMKELPELLGRKWGLSAKPTRQYIRARQSHLPITIFLSGLAFSIAVAAYFYAISRYTISKNARWRIQSILEGTHVGTWEWNTQSDEVVLNERWAEIIGYQLKELEPISIRTWMNLAHPEDLEKSNRLLHEHFEGKSEFYEIECRMKHKDGHWVWVHDRGKVFSWSADGKPVMMFGTHQDITDRKLAEQERERTIQELSKALSEIKTLRGIVPICASCKKIRDDQGFWKQVESYVAQHTEAEFSHGICPECEKELYAELTQGS